MDRKYTSYIPDVTIVAGTLLSFAAKPAATTDADRRKAEYLFLEAANAYTEARYDDYFMLLNRAAALDPSDPFIAGALAEIKLANSTSDSLTMEGAYRDLERRWLANPSDENNATVFASVAKSAGRIDDVIYVWETLDSLLPDRTDPAMNLASALVARGSTKSPIPPT